MVYRAEETVIIKAIRVSEQIDEQKVIITNSLSSLMAVEGNLNSKNPKTRTLRKLLSEEVEKKHCTLSTWTHETT
jgi:branched-subunit amino acid aminotransferase/4-amino-4-deoxychorismate lyase